MKNLYLQEDLAVLSIKASVLVDLTHVQLQKLFRKDVGVKRRKVTVNFGNAAGIPQSLKIFAMSLDGKLDLLSM